MTMASTDHLGDDMRSAGLSRLLVPLLTGLVLVLGAMNVATLVSASSHSLAFGLMERALLMLGTEAAESLLKKSPTRVAQQQVREATADLADKNRKLVAQNVDLDARRVKAMADAEVHKAAHAKANLELEDQVRKRTADAKHAKTLASSVRDRLTKGVSRNVAAIPAEAVPYIGLGITLSVTALDLYDACQTMIEINKLMELLDQGKENHDLCDQKTPSMEVVLEKMRTEWRASATFIEQEAKALPRRIPVPDVRLPTANDAKKVICPLIGSATWIAC